MRAVVYERYGPPEVLHLAEVPKPLPKDNEVLIKVFVTTVSTGDMRARSLKMPKGFGPLGKLVFGITKPRQPILGTELSGVVEAVGSAVTRFKPGDEVFAFPGGAMGAYAEYVTMPQDGRVVEKPANLTFDKSAALSFGGATALHFFRRGNLKRGESVLINGASGAVGSAAVQLAKHLGAKVTGVTSARNADLVKSIGADVVIDYARHDFATMGETYDVIMDTVGNAPYARVKDALRPGGRLLAVLSTLPELLGGMFVRGNHKVIAGPGAERREDLVTLAEIAKSGAYKPVIDRRFPLDQIVEAHRYVDQGHKKGNVVITLVSNQA